jgi:hypothetical protein
VAKREEVFYCKFDRVLSKWVLTEDAAQHDAPVAIWLYFLSQDRWGEYFLPQSMVDTLVEGWLLPGAEKSSGKVLWVYVLKSKPEVGFILPGGTFEQFIQTVFLNVGPWTQEVVTVIANNLTIKLGVFQHWFVCWAPRTGLIICAYFFSRLVFDWFSKYNKKH